MTEQNSPLSDFGERQTERIAERKAIKFDQSVGKYPNLRYQLAILLGLLNLGTLLVFVMLLIFSFIDMSLLYTAVGFLCLSYVLKRLSVRLTPNEIEC